MTPRLLRPGPRLLVVEFKDTDVSVRGADMWCWERCFCCCWQNCYPCSPHNENRHRNATGTTFQPLWPVQVLTVPNGKDRQIICFSFHCCNNPLIEDSYSLEGWGRGTSLLFLLKGGFSWDQISISFYLNMNSLPRSTWDCHINKYQEVFPHSDAMLIQAIQSKFFPSMV